MHSKKWATEWYLFFFGNEDCYVMGRCNPLCYDKYIEKFDGGDEMQKLYFEPAWDRTIAPADREKMMNHFQQQTKQLQSGVHFSFFRKARNYKDEQLITVLIHNYEEKNFRLQNTAIAYYEQGKQLANATFSLPVEIA